MKKTTARIGLILILAIVAALFTGCGDVETIAGTWKSGDGVSVTLTDEGKPSSAAEDAVAGCCGQISLCGADGENLLPEDSLPYIWYNDELNVTVDGTMYTVFTTDLNGDDLILYYSDEFFGDEDNPAGRIVLTRVD